MYVARLIAKQKALGLSDEDFASMLGCPRPTWRAARTGARGLGLGLVRKSMRLWPEMINEGTALLISGENEGTRLAKREVVETHG